MQIFLEKVFREKGLGSVKVLSRFMCGVKVKRLMFGVK